jgi:protein involved in polysaccharide export with SLBB domain
MRPDGERIRIGDIMSVEIAGEPDLPRMYTVQSSGTIRLPLIGAIRTEGSTAEQVAKDLRSLLASRQLGDREVVVHTHRRE